MLPVRKTSVLHQQQPPEEPEEGEEEEEDRGIGYSRKLDKKNRHFQPEGIP